MARAASALLLGLTMSGCPAEDGDGETTTSGPDTWGASTAYGAEESETFEGSNASADPPGTTNGETTQGETSTSGAGSSSSGSSTSTGKGMGTSDTDAGSGSSSGTTG